MIALLNANALHIPLADECVHAVVTSPPYYALRDYKTNGQLGLEKRADCLGWATGQPCGSCYICHMVAVFREVRRVLRSDGVCFLNVGDSYAASGGAHKPSHKNPGMSRSAERDGVVGNPDTNRIIEIGLKPKDMLLIPQRLVLALQANGWWVRSDIIWSKPNPMPESVTDRPTKAHEYIWLLAKSARYYWDQEAVRESYTRLWDENNIGVNNQLRTGELTGKVLGRDKDPHCGLANTLPANGRNLRTVWNIATQPYSGAHYATYPEELVLRCLKAATSERGVCPKCGKQWERMTSKGLAAHDGQTYSKYPDSWDTASGGHGTIHREGRSNGTAAKRLALLRQAARERGGEYQNDTATTGWRASCTCALPPVPATVFDPFAGSGTTLLVARRMGLNGVGLDLSYQYLHDNARERIGQERLI